MTASMSGRPIDTHIAQAHVRRMEALQPDQADSVFAPALSRIAEWLGDWFKPFNDFWDALWGTLGDKLLGWLPAASAQAPWMQTLLTGVTWLLNGLLVALGVLLVLMVVRLIRQYVARTQAKARPHMADTSEEAVPGLLSSRQHVDRAHAYAQQAQYRDSIREWHRATLAWLDESGRVRFEPARSNGETLRRLQRMEAMSRERVQDIRTMIDHFEQTHFGQRVATHEHHEACKHVFGTLRAAPEPEPQAT